MGCSSRSTSIRPARRSGSRAARSRRHSSSASARARYPGDRDHGEHPQRRLDQQGAETLAQLQVANHRGAGGERQEALTLGVVQVLPGEPRQLGGVVETQPDAQAGTAPGLGEAALERLQVRAPEDGAERLVSDLLRSGAVRGIFHVIGRAGPTPEGAARGEAELLPQERGGKGEDLRGLEAGGGAPGLGAVETLGLRIDPDVEVEISRRRLRAPRRWRPRRDHQQARDRPGASEGQEIGKRQTPLDGPDAVPAGVKLDGIEAHLLNAAGIVGGAIAGLSATSP